METVDELIAEIEQAGYVVTVYRGPIGRTTVWVYTREARAKLVAQFEGERLVIELLRQAKTELA